MLPNKPAKIEYAHRFADVIRGAQPGLVFFNFSSCILLTHGTRERAEAIAYQKQETFSRSVLSSLMFFREQFKTVNWTFDNVKDATHGGATEGWAEECFLGLQYTRLFTWACAGATILRPNFVKPGSHVLLEIADFISFWTAREFDKAVCGKATEMSSTALGKGTYEAILRSGDAESATSVGLPLKKFFGIDALR